MLEGKGAGVDTDKQAQASRPAGALRSPDEVMRINHAKSLLIETCSYTEAQAHRYLQKLSMETSRPMAMVAGEVIARIGA